MIIKAPDSEGYFATYIPQISVALRFGTFSFCSRSMTPMLTHPSLDDGNSIRMNPCKEWGFIAQHIHVLGNNYIDLLQCPDP